MPEFESRVGFIQRRLRPGPTGPSLEGLRGILARIAGDGRTSGVVLRLRVWTPGGPRWRSCAGRSPLSESAGRRSVPPGPRGQPFVLPGLRGRRDPGHPARDHRRHRAPNQGQLPQGSPEPYRSRGRGSRGLAVQVGWDPFVRNDFSRESREQAERLLDRRFEELVGAIARGRDLSLEEVRSAIDGAPTPHPRGYPAACSTVCATRTSCRRGWGRKGHARSSWSGARRGVRFAYRTAGARAGG